MYTAARAIAIGDRQDGAVELALGEYLVVAGNKRFGWEGSALIRRRGGVARSEARELDALVTIYVGW